MSGSAQQDQHHLRWNNHCSSLFSMFHQFFQTGSLTDVTLSCENMSIKCHKVVLAACSSYFHNLLVESNCPHPIVILKDMDYSHLKTILEFMYTGEVYVDQDQLPGLITAARTLCVRALVGELEESKDNLFETPPFSPCQSPKQISSFELPPPLRVSANFEKSKHCENNSPKQMPALVPFLPPQPVTAAEHCLGSPHQEAKVNLVQKQAVKRYKQYSRESVDAAIVAIRDGKSILQVAREHKVPSRTLYDKAKQHGITNVRKRKVIGFLPLVENLNPSTSPDDKLSCLIGNGFTRRRESSSMSLLPDGTSDNSDIRSDKKDSRQEHDNEETKSLKFVADGFLVNRELNSSYDEPDSTNMV